MKTAKKICAVILSVILLLNGCAMQNLIVISESETGGEVSRAQYVQMIYDNDGLEGSASNSPYFTDVDESNEFFNQFNRAMNGAILSKPMKAWRSIPKTVLQTDLP